MRMIIPTSEHAIAIRRMMNRMELTGLRISNQYAGTITAEGTAECVKLFAGLWDSKSWRVEVRSTDEGKEYIFADYAGYYR